MAKYKVLFIVEAMGGGVFTYIVDLANGLAMKHEVYIAYSKRPQTPKNFNEYFDERIHLIKVNNFTRAISPVKDFKATIELKNIVDKISPDIIHLHSSKAGVIGRILFGNAKIPLFYTPHGYSFLMKDCSKLKRGIYRSIEKIMSFGRCITISCSHGEHEETLKLTKNALYVNNGINIKQIDELVAKIPKHDHPFTVYTLGRICYQKNPSLFNSIAEAMPKVRFLWIGDGELRNELKASNIEITGWVDRNEALNYSVNADVFVLTSLWEGLPISLLESMYMKKKCIVSDVIGNHDVIRNNYNGFVCNTITEYVDAINNNHNSDIIENAYQEIIKIYNTTEMVKQYSTIYEKACDNI